MTELLQALDTLRANGVHIPTWELQRRDDWFDGLAELIAELPKEDQRMAWVLLIACDLCRRMPGMPIHIAAKPLLDKVLIQQESRR